MTARTRVVAVTWVHSGTGIRLPVAHIAAAIARANAGRDEKDGVLLCVIVTKPCNSKHSGEPRR